MNKQDEKERLMNSTISFILEEIKALEEVGVRFYKNPLSYGERIAANGVQGALQNKLEVEMHINTMQSLIKKFENYISLKLQLEKLEKEKEKEMAVEVKE